MSEKVFVIGFNKTGTTSVEYALSELGFKMGNQPTAEHLLKKVKKGRFKKLIRYTGTADAFQDVPFSLPGVYKKLFQVYPNAKFILTVRDSPRQWFNSIKTFHSKMFGNGSVPTEKQLREARYRYKGMAWDYINFVFDGVLYQESTYCKIYLDHIEEVTSFFKKEKGNLCVINTSAPDDYFKMCSFLKKKPQRDKFEWKNKTSEKE